MRVPAAARWAAFSVALAFLSGCSTYQQQNQIIGPWRAGNLAAAEKEATKRAEKKKNSKDAIIWRLEEGAVLRAGGKYEDSTKSFDTAEERINRYAEEAKTKLGNEAGALLSNQANLPYRGRAYDGIMLNTYKALNYMALGEMDKARIELNRTVQRQKDAVEENRREIEKTQQQLAKQKEKDRALIENAENNPAFQGEIQKRYAQLDRFKGYGDYVNPFATWLNGLFFLATGTDNSDLERSRQFLERTLSCLGGEQKTVQADLETVQRRLQGKPLTPTTYVIFETGCAPIRDQIRIDLPLLVTTVSYVGAAFPTLQPQGDYLPGLTLAGAGVTDAPALLCSMDSVIEQDFKNELPAIITKTVASTILKAAVATALNEVARQQNDEIYALSKLLTAAAQAAVNIADTRTWTTLPKEFQVCRFPTPPDRQLTISGAHGQNLTVTILEGTINVVYVKNTAAAAPLLISQMKLK